MDWAIQVPGLTLLDTEWEIAIFNKAFSYVFFFFFKFLLKIILGSLYRYLGTWFLNDSN